MDVSLDGKVALITGAGPNIGSGIALMLSKYGARVACNDVRLTAAQATVQRLERNGGQGMAVAGDVTNEADVKRYISDVLDAYGRIDILVNNAGLLGGKPLLLETLDDFNRAVEVTAAGHFLNTKYAAISMIERGIKGVIWAVVSSSGYQGVPGMIAYAFHKSGLFNFVRAAAMELAPYGIRVNSFTPAAPAPDNPDFLAQRATLAAPRPDGTPSVRYPPAPAHGTAVVVAAIRSDQRVPPNEEVAGPLPLIPMDVAQAASSRA